MTRLPLLISVVFVGLFVPSAVAVAAPVDVVPFAGEWASAGPSQAKGARAVVTFSVAEGTGLVVPAVDYRLRRCAGVPKRFSEKISLGSVSAVGGTFVVRNRHRVGKARVELRLRGVFDTEVDAHGWVRGKVKFRARRGRRAVVCALPKLSWTTSLAWADEDGDGVDDSDEFADDEFADDEGEFDEDSGDPGDDEDVDPDDGL